METTEAPVQTPEQIAQAVYNFAAHQLVNEKRTVEDVIAMLTEQGIDIETASGIVNNLKDQITDAKKARAKKDVLYGGLWFFGGLIVTALTYSAASGGGSYVIAWGAIIFGGIQFFRGVANS